MKPSVASRMESRIRVVRGQVVILDSDLAAIYGATTAALNQAVKRHRDRFPADFILRLTASEMADLISQSVTSSSRHGGRRKLPWVCTEHGALMAAAVLSSSRAVEMSVFVVRAFIRLRRFAHTHGMLAAKLVALERRVAGHVEELKRMFAALRALLAPPSAPRRSIGFGSK